MSIGGIVGIALVFGLTWLLMRLMWRQMRRVNAHTAAVNRERLPDDTPPLEEIDPATGEYRRVEPEVNDGLIRQGARARHGGWFLDP